MSKPQDVRYHVRFIGYDEMRIKGVEGQGQRQAIDLNSVHRPIPTAARYVSRKQAISARNVGSAGCQALTCFSRLFLRIFDDLLVALLTPYLVVVLHTAWLVHFGLLRATASAGATYKTLQLTYPHLRFLEVLAAPIVEAALQRESVTDAGARAHT